jgi:[ribosomal protein S5]-alanine N-acetyltransferase
LNAPALERVETPRMVASRLTEDDLPDLLLLIRDPRVATTLSLTTLPPSEAEVRAGLIESIGHWELHRFGLWLLRDRSTGELVGRGGLQHTWVTGRREVEVAWAVVPELWGRGLATESAGAALAAAFGPVGLDEVIAYTRPDNLASRRVMEKTGFEFERGFVTQGVEQVLYRRRSDVTPRNFPFHEAPGR